MARQTRYSSEFNEQAAALVNTSGRSIADVARSLDESARCGPGRARIARPGSANNPMALDLDDVAELKRLRKENAQQRADMEILRKAAA